MFPSSHEAKPTNYQLNYWILISGRIVSELGSAVFRFGLSLYILDLTGSATTFAWFLNCSILFGILVNLLAGSYIDRHNKKKLIVGADLCSGILVFAFLLVFQRDPENIMVILIYCALITILQAALGLAMNASIPELVSPEKTTHVNSIFQAITALIGILGPISGALVYKSLGVEMMLYLDGASFLLSGISEIFLGINSTKRVSRAKESFLGKYGSDLQLSVRYIRQEKLLLFFLVISALTNFVFVAMLALVLPYISYQIIKVSPLQLSLIEGSLAVGGILGAVYVSTQKGVESLLKKYFLFMQLEALLILFWIFPRLLAIADPTTWMQTMIYLGVLFLMGILGALQTIPAFTYFQLQIPENIRARVLGVAQAGLMLAVPLGVLVYGQLLESSDWLWVIVISVLLILLISLLAFKNRYFQQFREQRTHL